MNDKKLLINEIRNYNKKEPIYLSNNNLIKGYFSKTIIQKLYDEATRKKILIKNEYGLLGTLLDKYKDKLDDDILYEMCLHDLKNDYSLIFNINNPKLLYRICSNKRLILKLIAQGIDIKYFELDKILDKRKIKAILKINPDNYKEVNIKYKKDKQLISELISKSSRYFKYVDKSIKSDKCYIKKLIKFNGDIIEYIDESLKNDKEFIMEIIKEKAYLYKHIGEALKNDKDIISILEKEKIG